MGDTLIVAIIGLLGTVGAAVISYRQGSLKVAQDLQVEYDKDLRQRRIEQYQEVMKLMAPLAKYPHPEPLSREQVKSLALAFTQWYFVSGGGLFLSVQARERYFDLQDGLKIILQKWQGRWPESISRSTNIEEALRLYLDRSQSWECSAHIKAIAQAHIEQQHDYSDIWLSQWILWQVLRRSRATRCAVPDEIFLHVVKLGSALRTSLTEDVLTRRDTILKRQ